MYVVGRLRLLFERKNAEGEELGCSFLPSKFLEGRTKGGGVEWGTEDESESELGEPPHPYTFFCMCAGVR